MGFVFNALVELPGHMVVWAHGTYDTFLSPMLWPQPLVSEQLPQVCFGLEGVLASLCTMQLSAAVTFTPEKGRDSGTLKKEQTSFMCQLQMQGCILPP